MLPRFRRDVGAHAWAGPGVGNGGRCLPGTGCAAPTTDSGISCRDEIEEDIMGMLDGKVAIVTGAGRGIGREEALLLASEGARVIVNDIGASLQGEGGDKHPAEQVVELIKKGGSDGAVN